MKKRMLSILLALVMCVSMLPMQVFAAQDDSVTVTLDPETVVFSPAETSAQAMSLLTLDDAGKGALKATNEVEWIDRLDLTGAIAPTSFEEFDNNYALGFYHFLVDNSAVGGALSTSSATEYTAVIMTGQGEYTYTGDDAVDKEAALAAVYDEMKANWAEVQAYLSAVYYAFDRDHPEVFWLSGECKFKNYSYYNYSSDGTVTYDQIFVFVLRDEEEGFDIRDGRYLDESLNLDEEWINEIDTKGQAFATEWSMVISEIAQTDSREQALRDLHEYLITSNEYNTSDDLSSADSICWEYVTALVGGEGDLGPVCEAYARAFKVVCDKAGIPCVLVDGYASPDGVNGEAHMWNYVQMDDGLWYAVDVTWDDPVVADASGVKSGYEHEDYFLVGAQTEIDGVTFEVSHPVSNAPSSSAPNFTNGPVLSDDAYVAPEGGDTEEPADLAVTDLHFLGTPGSIGLEWTAPANAEEAEVEYYMVYYSTDGGETWEYYSDFPETYIDLSLPGGVYNAFKVETWLTGAVEASAETVAELTLTVTELYLDAADVSIVYPTSDEEEYIVTVTGLTPNTEFTFEFGYNASIYKSGSISDEDGMAVFALRNDSAVTKRLTNENSKYLIQELSGFYCGDSTMDYVTGTTAGYTVTTRGDWALVSDAVEGDEPEIIDSGVCGDDLTWTVVEITDEDVGSYYVLTISGTGAMYNYEIEEPGWYIHRGQTLKVVLPEGMTTIGKSAFYDFGALVEVDIPDSVTTIGMNAFNSCSALETLDLGSGVESIGTNAFKLCTALNELVIPDSVTQLWDSAFESCTALESVTLGSGVDYIDNFAFMYCENLTGIVIPNNVLAIGGSAFEFCYGLESVDLGSGVEIIVDGAFGHTALTEVIIPGSVNDLGNWTFWSCTGLTKVTFEGDAPAIGENAFCDVTATCYYPAGNDTWTEFLQQEDTNFGGTLTWVPVGEVMPEIIASGECGDNLTWELTDDGVLTISGTGAMYDYDARQDTTLPGWHEYAGSITAVCLSKEQTTIGENAFIDLTALAAIAVPDSVESIGYQAFWGCKALKDISFGSGLKSIGDYVFLYCNALKTLEFGSSLESIGMYAFAGCESLAEVSIPDNVTSLGKGAFCGCPALTKVQLGSGVKTLDHFVFQDCSLLSEVVGLEHVTTINNYAFAGTALTEITIPASVQTIGNWTFQSCESLTKVVFEGDAPSIGDYAFQNVTATVYYPSDNTTWTEAVMQNYGGTLTWVAVDGETIVRAIVNFDLNTDDENVWGDLAPATVEAGDTVELPVRGVDFDRAYYVFKGWFTQPEGGEQVTNETPITEDCTLYAHWELRTTVTLILYVSEILGYDENGEPYGDWVEPGTYTLTMTAPDGTVVPAEAGTGAHEGGWLFRDLVAADAYTLTIEREGYKTYTISTHGDPYGAGISLAEMGLHSGGVIFSTAGIWEAEGGETDENSLMFRDFYWNEDDVLVEGEWFYTGWNPSVLDNMRVRFYFGTEDSYVAVDPGSLSVSGKGIYLECEYTEDGAVDYVWIHTIAFGDYQVIYTHTDGKEYSIPVTVGLPDVGFYSQPVASEENYLWEQFTVTEENNTFYFVPREGRLTRVALDERFAGIATAEITEGGYAVITVTAVPDGNWYHLNYDFEDTYGNSFTNWGRGLNIKSGIPHLMYRSFYWNENDELVEDKWFQSEYHASIQSGMRARFYFGSEDNFVAVNPDSLSVSGTGIALEWVYTEDGAVDYVWVRAVDFGDYEVIYTAEDGTRYTLPVTVGLPDVGFYSTSVASEKSYLYEAFTVTAENNTFYLVPINGALTNVELLDELAEIATVTLSENGSYAAITVNGTPNGRWYNLRVQFTDSYGNSHSWGVGLNIYDGNPHLMYRYESGEGLYSRWEIEPGMSSHLVFYFGTEGNYAEVDFARLSVSDSSALTLSEGDGFVRVAAGYICGEYSIIYTDENGKTYELPVVVALPDVGVYSTSLADPHTRTIRFVVTDENDTFYVVSLGGTMSKVVLSDALAEIAEITEHGANEDGEYIAIKVTGTPTSGVWYEIELVYYGYDGLSEGTWIMSVMLEDARTVDPEEPEIIASGVCGDDLTWELTDDGVLTISGEGQMYNYGSLVSGTNLAPWSEYREIITNVGIGENVTGLGNFAFVGCTALTEMTIPDQVQTLGTNLFRDCTALKRVNIGAGVSSFSAYLFYGCTSLENMEIPAHVTTLEKYAFYGCTALTEVTIPNTVTSLGESAFRCCKGLIRVTLGEGVIDLGKNLFYDCVSLTEIYFPNKLTSLGEYTFYNCKALTAITIPNVSNIGKFTFNGCTSLSEVIIPDSVTSIGSYAFSGCTSLKNISLPSGVTLLSSGIFEGCTALTEITIPKAAAKIDSWAFQDCDALSKVIFEGDAPEIYYNAFYNVEATCYYPAGNDTWTEEARQDYYGTLTWKPYGYEDDTQKVGTIYLDKQHDDIVLSWKAPGKPRDDLYYHVTILDQKGVTWGEMDTYELRMNITHLPVGSYIVQVASCFGDAGLQAAVVETTLTVAESNSKYPASVMIREDETNVYISGLSSDRIHLFEIEDGSLYRVVSDAKGLSVVYGFHYPSRAGMDYHVREIALERAADGSLLVLYTTLGWTEEGEGWYCLDDALPAAVSPETGSVETEGLEGLTEAETDALLDAAEGVTVEMVTDQLVDYAPGEEGSTVDVEVVLNVTVTGYNVLPGEDEAAIVSGSKALTLDIEPVAIVTTTDAQGASSSTTQTVDTTGTYVLVKIPLPAGFAEVGDKLYVIHTKDDGSVISHRVTVLPDENGSLYVSFMNANGFSTFSVTSNVASVSDGEGNETVYSDLNAAIMAAASIENGATVTLLVDLEVEGVVIPKGVTLDLAGFALTADYVVGLNGSSLTATPNAGKLIVEQGSLVLAEQGYVNSKGQYILPIWDPAQNCYLFSLFVVSTTDTQGNRGLFIDEENETIRFQFKHQATGAINRNLLNDGSSDNAMKVIVRLVWESENGEAYQDFVYNDGFVKKVAVGEGGVSFDYSFTLSGYSAMNIKLDTLKVVGMIITDSGAVASGTVWTAEMAK